MSGISRTLSVKYLPSKTTLEAALHDVPEIQHIYYRELQEGGVSGDQFTFRSATAGGTIETRHAGDSRGSLKLYSLWLNARMPREEADNCDARLDKVYASLRQLAPSLGGSGLQFPVSGVREVACERPLTPKEKRAK